MTTTPLLTMAQTTETQYWNDSCNTKELEYALANGAVGATSNPTIVGTVFTQQREEWEPRLRGMIQAEPTATAETIAWRLMEAITLRGAELLMPIYTESHGTTGRIAIQVNPEAYRDAEAMIEQGRYLHGLAENFTIKLPATAAGIEAAEALTYHGASITSTVSFTVAQVCAAAEAVERGLRRREQEGLPIDTIAANCVVMVGRVDDWLKVVANKEDTICNPAAPEWAGVAVLKKAYRIFQDRGYRSRLMAAAYRNHLHWSEFIGGDVITTIPYKWARRFNGSDVPVSRRIDDPVDAAILKELIDKFPEFRKAYDEQGLTVDEFQSYGATARTLRGFIGSYVNLVGMVREVMLPDPDR